MTSALVRGRTLDLRAVAKAKNWRNNRLKEIMEKCEKGSYFSGKERAEARRLTGRWDFWNYGGD